MLDQLLLRYDDRLATLDLKVSVGADGRIEAIHAAGAVEFIDQAGVLAGFDEDVFLGIEGENFFGRVVTEHPDERGIDVEKFAFEARAIDSVDGGLNQRTVANFGAAQVLLVAFAVDGGG